MTLPTAEEAALIMGRELADSIRVKNTFIDGFDSDNEMEEVAMTKTKSCPAKASVPRKPVPDPIPLDEPCLAPAPPAALVPNSPLLPLSQGACGGVTEVPAHTSEALES